VLSRKVQTKNQKLVTQIFPKIVLNSPAETMHQAKLKIAKKPPRLSLPSNLKRVAPFGQDLQQSRLKEI
jgi:hypothetical protein